MRPTDPGIRNRDELPVRLGISKVVQTNLVNVLWLDAFQSRHTARILVFTPESAIRNLQLADVHSHKFVDSQRAF